MLQQTERLFKKNNIGMTVTTMGEEELNEERNLVKQNQKRKNNTNKKIRRSK